MQRHSTIGVFSVILEFIIVRHGETDWNLDGKKQGQTETILNETGLKQAKDLAEKLATEKIDVIYSSDLPRALETAKEINRFHKLKIRKTNLLREINLGDCNGLTSEEMRENFPEWRKLKDAEPEKTPYPNGESHTDVQARIKEFLKQITNEKHKTVLIVAHQGLNRNLIQILTDMTYAEQSKMDFNHNIIYRFDTKTKRLANIKLNR